MVGKVLFQKNLKKKGVQVGVLKDYFVNQTIPQQKTDRRSSGDHYGFIKSSPLTSNSGALIVQKMKARLNIRDQGHIGKC